MNKIFYIKELGQIQSGGSNSVNGTRSPGPLNFGEIKRHFDYVCGMIGMDGPQLIVKKKTACLVN